MDASEFKRWVSEQANKDTPQLIAGKGARKCPVCHEVKAETNFTWASGLGYFCKDCSRKKLGAVKKHFERRKSGVRK